MFFDDLETIDSWTYSETDAEWGGAQSSAWKSSGAYSYVFIRTASIIDSGTYAQILRSVDFGDSQTVLRFDINESTNASDTTFRIHVGATQFYSKAGINNAGETLNLETSAITLTGSQDLQIRNSANINLYSAGNTFFADRLRVRKYVASEPTVGVLGSEENANTPPTATAPTATQATDGSGYVTIATTIDDADNNDTVKFQVEYSLDGGSTWTSGDPILTSYITTSPNQATEPDVDNAETYQVGMPTNKIITSAGANTINIKWDTKSASNGLGAITSQANVKLRITPSDGTADGTPSVSAAAFAIDNVAPTNQDTVFASSTSKQSSEAVTIVSSGDATNNIWFAPTGTTTFAEGATMTKAASGTATSILAPATVGDYKLFVIDAAGNYSTESIAILTVDGSAPTIISISSDKPNGTYTTNEVIDIDITFSEAVTSTGNITVTLETGDTDRTCVFTITNSTTGTCDYTVQAGDNSPDLDATISGTIADQASNALTNYIPATTLATSKDLLIDTTAPTETTLTLGTIATDSITATISGTIDSGAGLHATSYYFENTTTSTNSGWTGNTSWASQSLSCGTTYSFRVKTKDVLNNESSFTTSSTATSGCGGGLPPVAYNPPTPPPVSSQNPEGGFRVTILRQSFDYAQDDNNKAQDDNNTTVTLKLYAGGDTKRMAISNTPDFANASQVPYQENIDWKLSDCNTLSKNPPSPLLQSGNSQEGNICVVYAKFYTQYGVSSEVVSDSIILKITTIENQTETSNQKETKPETENNKDSESKENTATEDNQSTPTIFTQTLQFGSNNQEVKTLQNKLKELNFFPKDIESNGNFGPATENAIREYQKSKGIYPCGIVGPRTRKALNNEEFITNKDYQFTQDLKYNDKTEDVKQLQTRLRDQNFFPYNISSTGWFGPITEKAVNLFQGFYDLIRNGIVDERMREILNK